MIPSNPWSWYLDEAVLERERESLFRPAWHYVGHSGQLDGPGSYVTTSLLDVPVVVVRDGAHLRAFANVCRHRGAVVVRAACGVATSLQCQYHAWTYGLDGQLRGAPRSDREPDVDRGALGLRPLAIDAWGPFVFVHLDESPPPLAAALGDLPDRVAAAGVDVDALRFHHRVTYPLACNWKVAIENFLECYHCPLAHPGFSRVLDVGPDAYELEVGERYLSQRAVVRDPQAGYDTRGEVPSGQYHVVWPSLKLNIHPGRPNLSIGPVHPVTPSTSTAFLDYFFGPDVDEGWIADLLAFDDQVGAEDTALIESVQQGLRGRAIDRGVVLADAEQLLIAFQRYVRERIGGP